MQSLLETLVLISKAIEKFDEFAMNEVMGLPKSINIVTFFCDICFYIHSLRSDKENQFITIYGWTSIL